MKDKETEQAQWFVDEVLPHEEDLRNWLDCRFPKVEDVNDLAQGLWFGADR